MGAAPINFQDPRGHSASVVHVHREKIMLYYAVLFFIVALVAAVFGFGGIAAGAAGIAQFLFFAFLVIAVVTLLMSLVRK